MKNSEYIPLAIRTESPLIIGENRHLSRLLHAAVGVSTEIAEFFDSGGNPVNEVEELGDICWYLAIATDEIAATGLVIQSGGRKSKSKREEFQREALLRSGVFLDTVKKYAFYGKVPKETDLVMQVFNLWQAVANLSAACGYEFSEVMEANIRKLHVRYPEKFTVEAEASRNVPAEQAAVSK